MIPNTPDTSVSAAVVPKGWSELDLMTEFGCTADAVVGAAEESMEAAKSTAAPTIWPPAAGKVPAA